MPEPKRERQLTSGEMISRAAKALKTMTILERAEIMLRAGLLTQEQYEEAEKKFGNTETVVETH